VIRKLAHITSLIGHPVFVPIYGILAIVNFHLIVQSKLNAQPKWFWVGMFVLILSLLPLMGVMFVLNKHRAPDLAQINRKERRLAAWLLCLMYAVEFWVFNDFFFHPILKTFVLALCFSSGLLAVLNGFLKVSIHAFGWSGLFVLMLVLAQLNAPSFVFWVLLTLLSAGVVGTSRLILGVHSSREVYTGFITGLICNIAVYMIFYGRF